MDARKIIGRVLRDARRGAALSQEELALRTEMDHAYPSMMERGLRSPTLLTFLRICKALGIEPHVLLRRITDSMK